MSQPPGTAETSPGEVAHSHRTRGPRRRPTRLLIIAGAVAVVVIVAVVVVVLRSGSSQPSGDATACHEYSQWLSVGGESSSFGNFTNLLDSAVSAAGSVPGSDARAIANGLSAPPANDPGARLLWDLSNVQADAEGDLNPPIGWSQEVGQVTLDCDNKL